MRLTILPELAHENLEEDTRTLEEKVAAIAAKVPEEEWAKLPADMGDHLDHYIYGTPKKQIVLADER